MRWKPPLLLLGVLGLPFLLSCGGSPIVSTTSPPPSNQPPPMPALSPFVSGLTSPVGFEVPNDGTNRIFIFQQGGAIRIIQKGTLLSAPFLDVSSNPGFESGGEKGLLGLAFHPGFNASGKFYVYYTRRVSGQLQSVFSEFIVSPPNANVASIFSERQLLVVNQPFDNHNDGELPFVPVPAELYIALGDGVSEGEPQRDRPNPNV